MGEEKQPESYGKSLLIDAVSRENVEDVKWLTTYIGCSVNDRSNDGTTPQYSNSARKFGDCSDVDRKGSRCKYDI